MAEKREVKRNWDLVKTGYSNKEGNWGKKKGKNSLEKRFVSIVHLLLLCFLQEKETI